jgi:hypothetical protein
MRCPHYQHENREGARFCAACGSSFASKCPACGSQAPSGAAFYDSRDYMHRWRCMRCWETEWRGQGSRPRPCGGSPALWGVTGNWTTSHETSQSRFYQWRDQFLANAAKAFESQQQGRREARLGRENAQLKMLAGELLLELKKGRRAAGLTRPRSLQATQHDERRLPQI